MKSGLLQIAVFDTRAGFFSVLSRLGLVFFPSFNAIVIPDTLNLKFQ
jgi:hypothetical protein